MQSLMQSSTCFIRNKKSKKILVVVHKISVEMLSKENQEDQNFFLCNEFDKTKEENKRTSTKSKYSNTKIKVRNFLTKLSY